MDEATLTMYQLQTPTPTMETQDLNPKKVFDTITFPQGFGSSRVNCLVLLKSQLSRVNTLGNILYGTDDGVYLYDTKSQSQVSQKVLSLPEVTQIETLEEEQLVLVLSARSTFCFSLDSLDPSDPEESLNRGSRISSGTSFLKAGSHLGRNVVCLAIVNPADAIQTTFKLLEPLNVYLRIRKIFFIPIKATSIHFLTTKFCIGHTKGIEIVDPETLQTVELLDPEDSSLDFAREKRMIDIHCIDGHFLLCYEGECKVDVQETSRLELTLASCLLLCFIGSYQLFLEFAFYIDEEGHRFKGDWIVKWEGTPTAFALHYPYLLAFQSSLVEVRDVRTGTLSQVIVGSDIRCLDSGHGTIFVRNQNEPADMEDVSASDFVSPITALLNR